MDWRSTTDLSYALDDAHNHIVVAGHIREAFQCDDITTTAKYHTIYMLPKSKTGAFSYQELG